MKASKEWKRGVLFACVVLKQNTCGYDDNDDDFVMNVNSILRTAGIEKDEIKPLLKESEDEETIELFISILNNYTKIN